MANRSNIESLFKANYQQMFWLAKALLHDDESARDIVHDVFESLLYRKSVISVTAGYLASAVRNRALNQIRDRCIHDRILSLNFTKDEEYESENWLDGDIMETISQVIESELTPQCRRVMELRFVDGLTFSKVADTLGVSESAVYKHVRHALVVIRKKLNENG